MVYKVVKRFYAISIIVTWIGLFYYIIKVIFLRFETVLTGRLQDPAGLPADEDLCLTSRNLDRVATGEDKCTLRTGGGT